MPDAPISVQEFRERVLGDLTPLPVYPMPLAEAAGLTTVVECRAKVSLPHFLTAATDGYAVAWHDVATATAKDPKVLPVVGENAPGTATLLALPPRAAAKIAAGARLPVGADTVVRTSDTDGGVAVVRVRTSPRAVGGHVRAIGEEWAEGDVTVPAGTVLGPRHLGVLAGTGVASVSVRPRPRVVVISTGSELREPGQQLGSDSVHDANSFLLAAAVRETGALAYRVGVVPDEPRAFVEAVEDQLVRADLVLISGGASEGEHDVVRRALASRGVWCGGVAVEPGSAHGFGLIGPDQTPVVVLPGQSAAAWVSFHLFVVPALRRLQGLVPDSVPTKTMRLGESISLTSPLRHYLPATMSLTLSGPTKVVPLPDAPPRLLSSWARASGAIVVPENSGLLGAGSDVEVVMFRG